MITALWIVLAFSVGVIFFLLIDIHNLNETMRLHDEARDFNLRLMGFDGLHDGEN